MVRERHIRTTLTTTRGLILLLALFFALGALGCSGPLEVAYSPRPGVDDFRIKGPLSIEVSQFTDSRPSLNETDRRRIGEISATVSDIFVNHLTLSEDPASLVRKAFVSEAKAMGYDVREAGAGGTADFILTGDVLAFRLDIGARDEVEISLKASFTDNKTGNAVWSGTETVKEDRFAGVMGNSRRTVSLYITDSLSRVVGKTLKEAGPLLAKAAEPEPEVLAAPPSLTPSTPPPPPPPAYEPGKLSIKTTPAKARVYIGDVYYGMTPITIEMEPGIYDLTIKHSGFRSAKERVSVRKGETTEFEATLEKGSVNGKGEKPGSGKEF